MVPNSDNATKIMDHKPKENKPMVALIPQLELTHKCKRDW